MKIGKISGYGRIKATGKWYPYESLYLTNRIYIVHSGVAYFKNGAELCTFQPGYIYFIPSMNNFCPLADEGEIFDHSYVDFSVTSPIKQNGITALKIPDDEEMRTSIEVFSLIVKKKGLHRSERVPAFDELFSMFEDAVSYVFTRVMEFAGVEMTEDEVVSRALYMMNRRMNEKITVSDIAAYVYMSDDGFIRRFSKVMKMTPYSYLKKLRLTTAEGMIIDGETVSNAAAAVGYSDAPSLLHAISIEKRKNK